MYQNKQTKDKQALTNPEFRDNSSDDEEDIKSNQLSTKLTKHNNDILVDFFHERNCMKIIAFFLVNDHTKYYRKTDISIGTGLPIVLINKYILWITKSRYNILEQRSTTFEWHAHNVNVYRLNTDLKIIRTLKRLIKDLNEM